MKLLDDIDITYLDGFKLWASVRSNVMSKQEAIQIQADQLKKEKEIARGVIKI